MTGQGTGPGTGTEPVIVGPPAAEDVRSGGDVVRLVLAVAVLAAAVVLAWLADDTLRKVQDQVADVAQLVPRPVRVGMAGGAQLAVVLVPAAVVVLLLVNRRTRVLGRVLLAAAVTEVLGLGLRTITASGSSAALEAAAGRDSWIRSSGWPGDAYLAALAAAATVAGPWVSRGWRRAMWTAIGIVAALRMLSVASAPFELLAAGALGVAVGAAVLLIFGAPDRSPSARSVADALIEAGLALRRLEFERVDREGARRYRAETADGARYFVALLSDDDRRRDLIFRIYRYLRVRSIADEEVFRSTRSLAEHRAFLSLWANQAGVAAPRPVRVVFVGTGALAVVEEEVGGSGLDELDDGAVGHPELRAVWAQADALHQAHIAHRDLRAPSIRLQPGASPQVWLVDFTWAELAASPQLLAVDLAQLLVELSLIAGVETTVATAAEVLGAERLATAIPYLQLPALADETRRRARKQKGLVKDLHTAVVEATGAEDVPLEKLERVTLRQLATVAFIGLAVYLLLPMFTSLPEVWDAVQEATWGWILATIPLMALLYVGATFNFQGAVPGRLPFSLTYVVQLASAFLNRVTPMNVGGMGLRLRFLTLRGMDPVTAGGSVGLTSLGGTVSTTILMVVFGLWAGRSDELDFSIPSVGSVLIIIGGLVVLLALFTRTKVGHRLVVEKGWGYVRTALSNLGPLLATPSKLAMLLGGSALNTLCQIVALSWTLRAFGESLPFAQVGVVFLFANLVASASPTPGGIGVIEASQVFLLVRLGVPDAVATSTILVFRTITYWLVTAPGWLAFRHLQRIDAV